MTRDDVIAGGDMLTRVKVGHLVTRDDVIVGNDVIAGG